MKQIKKPIFVMSLAFTLSMGANTIAFADNEGTEKIVSESNMKESTIQDNHKLDMDTAKINVSTENEQEDFADSKSQDDFDKDIENYKDIEDIKEDSNPVRDEKTEDIEKSSEKADKKIEKSQASEEKVKSKAMVKGDAKANVQRVVAKNRYQEAVDIQNKEFKDSDTVVIANSESFADGISATNVTNGKSPILYTEKDSLNSITAKALKENKNVKKVYIMGGANAVSAKAIEEIKALGLEVVVLDGKDRYETNVKAAEVNFKPEEGKKQNVVIASGESYADSLTASALAKSKDAPVLLTQKDKLSNPIREYLAKLTKNNLLANISIIGGVNAISKDIEEELLAFTKNIKRIAGSDRYATSVAIAKEIKAKPERIMVAGGSSHVDAILAAPVAQKYKAPIILSKADDLSRTSEYKNQKEDLSVEKYLSDNKDSLMDVRVFGGSATVNNFAFTGIEDLLNGKSLKAKPKVQALSNADQKIKEKEEAEKKANQKSNSKIDQLINLAKAQVGKAYVYGSQGPNAFDCSGLTSYLYKQIGISINRNSRAQASNGVSVSRNNLKAGDLMFFNTGGSGISHVGIYIGDNKLIHASTPSTGVIVSDINGNYYRNTYVTARRILV